MTQEKHELQSGVRATAELTGLPAGVAVSTMARLLAAVEAAVQLVATDHEALVLRILDGQKQKKTDWKGEHKFCRSYEL